ncbi:MAG: hypothetical protein QOE56_2379 [Solirubrobacterales bacterium]|jgi:acyl dehydratase|nr:hypothetical protein [Solirubrobacterales bacterium]
MRTLATVLADPNPIHLDRDAVQRLGMGDKLVNQGPANYAYVLDMLREAVPGAELRETQFRLLANVFEGGCVRAGGTVVAIENDEQWRTIKCDVWLEVAENRARAIEGTAELRFPQGMGY